MKRFGWTALFAILGVICAVQAWRHFRVFAQPPDATFSAPGQFKFKAPDSATYTLWQDISASGGKFSIGGFNLTATRGTKATETETGLPPGSTVTVTQGTAAQSVRASPGMTVSINGEKRKSVLEFDGTKDADYIVTVAGLPRPQRFLVSHNPLFQPLLWSMVWGAAVCGLAAKRNWSSPSRNSTAGHGPGWSAGTSR